MASPAVWLMSKHSMRNAAGSADVEVQRFDQCAGALLLRALFGQQPRQRQLGAFGRHLQPNAALLARLVLGPHTHARGVRQRLQQLGRNRMAQHQLRRHRLADVVLRDKGFEHSGLG